MLSDRLSSAKSDESYIGILEDYFLECLESEKPMRFSPEQIRRFTTNFSIHIGSGSCGDVYKGNYNGQSVAVKVLKEEVLSDHLKDQFLAEVSTLGKTHHKNLVKLYGFCFQPNMKALVYEYMERESLDKILYGKSSLKWETLCNIAIGTAKGLAYLHEDCQPSIIHYDIKPSNILIDSKFSPKIGDFGLAKLLKMDASHATMSKFRGTPYYCAPELSLPYLQVNHKCDVYSYGMTLFDIVSMEKHQRQEAEHWFPRQVWDKYEKGKLEEVMAECIVETKDREMAKRILMIALSCVEFWASERPSMKDVVRLLEATEDPQMLLPKHFLSSLQVSSDVAPNRKGDQLRGVHEIGKMISNSHQIEKIQILRSLKDKIFLNDEGFVSTEGAFTQIFLNDEGFVSTEGAFTQIFLNDEGFVSTEGAFTQFQMFGDHWVEEVCAEEVEPIKQNVSNKKSHFPLFLWALFLILFLKFHVHSLFDWFKKLVEKVHYN